MKKGIDASIVILKASEIADREGFASLSFARLAKELSIQPPSLYNHVRSLGDLKLAIATVAARGIAESLARAMVGKSGEDAVRSGALAFRSYVLVHPGTWQTLCLVPGAEVERDPELRLASSQIIQTMAAGLGAYQLNEADLIHAIRSLRSLVHGFTSLEVVGGFGMPIAVDDSFLWMLEAFLLGIAARVSGPLSRA